MKFLIENDSCDDVSGTVYYNYRHYEPMMGRWMSRDPIGEESSPYLYAYVDNAPLWKTDFCGLMRLLTPKEEKAFRNGKIGTIRCNERCELEVYLPENISVDLYPKDCQIEHEEQHIRDLDGKTECKKSKDGCCGVAGLFFDASDYGGNENLKSSECAAYLVTAKCCARKADMLQKMGGNRYNEMVSLRRCVLAARDSANSSLGIIKRDFGSPCNNQDKFNLLLKNFNEYFMARVER